MNYEGNIIRPPSEANSIILQATVGCSHNRCSFCGAYKGRRFRIKDEREIEQDLNFAARHCQRLQKVFLADGDALIIPQARLLMTLGRIRDKLPWVNRISLYGNARSLRSKSIHQLQDLKKLGLDRIYMGLESGHDPTLAAVGKGESAASMTRAGSKARAAGLFLSVTVLLGVAGIENSAVHAEATAAVLNEMAPNQIAVLTLMLLPNTPLFEMAAAGTFKIPDRPLLLAELKKMVENIELDRVQFQANHSSNYLLINGRLARDKKRILTDIDRALAGDLSLIPENMRAL